VHLNAGSAIVAVFADSGAAFMTVENFLALTGLHHVSLRVKDLDRSLALYRDTLSFPLKSAWTLGGRRFALLDAGNSGYIELVETTTDIHAAREDDSIWHFAIRTHDIERAVRAIEQAGYVITRPMRDLDLPDSIRGRPFAIRVAFFRGPDGEDVELFEDRTGHT
jgi:glyoxylase I family protein